MADEYVRKSAEPMTKRRSHELYMPSEAKAYQSELPFYLKISQAALLLQSGPRPLYRAAKEGRLRAVRINARGDLRTTREWLAEYIEKL